MKMITGLTVAATVLGAATADSSVGGPMTFLFIMLAAVVAVGIHEAWANGRGAPGWIVNIVVSVVTGIVAIALFGVVMEEVLDSLRLGGSLASSYRPLLYLVSVVMAIFIVVVPWGALQLVNRFR